MIKLVTRRLEFGERRKAINITLHPDVLEFVDDAAWKQRKTLSRFINDILADWIQAVKTSEEDTLPPSRSQ